MKFVWPLVGICAGVTVGALLATVAAIRDFDLHKLWVYVPICGAIGFFGGIALAILRPERRG